MSNKREEIENKIYYLKREIGLLEDQLREIEGIEQETAAMEGIDSGKFYDPQEGINE